jgi:sugar phosphate isomerase/epimerase
MGNVKAGLIGLLDEEYKKDFWGTVEKLASIGYKGIEGVPEELYQGNTEENFKRLNDLGLEIISVGSSKQELRDNLNKVVLRAKTSKAKQVSVFWGPCESKEQLIADAKIYNAAGETLTKEGIKLTYHNHEHEFRTFYNGIYAFDILVENTDADKLYFEVDVAWVQFGGEDPVKIMKRLAGRIPTIHVKDLYDLKERGKFTTVGTGLVNIVEIIKTAKEIGVQWLVVEQDYLRNLSALETVTASYLNLKETGLL